MNIAFDIDDTLFNNHLIFDVMHRHKLDPLKVLRNFHIKNLEISKDIKNEIYQEFKSKRMYKLKPNDNAQFVIEKLLEHGHNIYLITARDKEMKDQTYEMVKKYFPGIKKENLFYCPKGKLGKLKDLKIDFFVEDNIEAVINLTKELDITYFVLQNDNTPHNWDIVNSKETWLNKNIIIIHDLKELLLGH